MAPRISLPRRALSSSCSSPGLLPWSVLLLGFLGAVSAPASDGVREISQTCAQVGCFAGDSAGFPVTLTSAGSYVLTSDLEPAGTDAIQIATVTARLDLNGFAIRGPGDCTGQGGANLSCSGNAGTGISVALGLGDDVAVSIRNGTIRGMSTGLATFGASSASISDMTVIECSGVGISFGSGRISNVIVKRNGSVGIGAGSLLSEYTIQDSVISRNGGDGISAGGGPGLLRGNTIYDNGGWGLNSDFLGATPSPGLVANSFSGNDLGDVRGGTSIGGNFCTSTVCP